VLRQGDRNRLGISLKVNSLMAPEANECCPQDKESDCSTTIKRAGKPPQQTA